MDVIKYIGDMRQCDCCCLLATEVIIKVGGKQIQLCTDCRKQLMKRLIDEL